jgi:hypothetical protein
MWPAGFVSYKFLFLLTGPKDRQCLDLLNLFSVNEEPLWQGFLRGSKISFSRSPPKRCFFNSSNLGAPEIPLTRVGYRALLLPPPM